MNKQVKDGMVESIMGKVYTFIFESLVQPVLQTEILPLGRNVCAYNSMQLIKLYK